MGSPVVHWELWSKDPEALTRFCLFEEPDGRVLDLWKHGEHGG